MLDEVSAWVDEAAQETAAAWVSAFGLALTRSDARALTDLFVSDHHWRNLFGLSWHFATFSGSALARELMQPARDACAKRFSIDAAALAPHKSLVTGRDVIEAILAFESLNGPGYGALRLLPAPNGRARAWTISTSRHFAGPRLRLGF
jgi:hypothetical protein